MQFHRSVEIRKNQSERYMDGDVCVTTCETAWTRRKHAVNAGSEIGTTVTVTVERVAVDS